MVPVSTLSLTIIHVREPLGLGEQLVGTTKEKDERAPLEVTPE